MPPLYTQNLGIEKPDNGEEDGSWGVIVNENMDILDRAINGSLALSLSGTASTLTTTGGTLNDGQYKLLVLGGTPSGTHTITISPNTAQKIYFVRNTTAQSVVFTQGSGGNVTIATGDSGIIYTNGAGASAAVVNITNDFAMSSAKITGGTIDGTTIGGTTAAVGTFTTANATTVDSTNLEVTNLKAKDGTSAGSIADTTGIVTLASSVLTTTDINGGTVDGTSVGATTASTVRGTTITATTGFSGDVTGGVTVGAGKTLDVSAGTLTLADNQISGDKVEGGTINATTVTTLTSTTGNITSVNATTVDTTNLEVTTLKSKDGTTAGSIADTTGIVTLASSVLTTTDINGGTIDNATVATSNVTVGSGKTLDVSAGTLTLADNQISGDKVEGGTINSTTITTLTSTTGNITSVNATTVDTTNLEVTNLKAKDGTSAGSIANTTGIVTLASSVLTTTDINGGTIDGTVIGGTTPATITGTTIAAAAGTQAAPGYTFSTDPDTGMFTDAANTISFATSGSKRLTVTGTALQAGFLGSPLAPAYTFSSDPDTGMYRVGPNAVGIASGGIEQLVVASDTMYLPAATTEAKSFRIGLNRAGNGDSSLDLIGDATYTEYGAQLTRTAGANGTTALTHRGTGPFILQVEEVAPIVFFNSSAESARFDVNGRFLVGRTSYGIDNTTGVQANELGQLFVIGETPSVLNRINTDGTILQFRRQNTTVGSINVTGSATSYATSSDYRLKDNVTPVTGASDRLMLLNPCSFNFLSDPSNPVDGFLAHEAQAVVPNAVMGVKDEVDAQGAPVYQSIDHSKMVPLLTAALQEALAKIAALEVRIAALEA